MFEREFIQSRDCSGRKQGADAPSTFLFALMLPLNRLQKLNEPVLLSAVSDLM